VFVLASASACFCFAGLFLRFAGRRWSLSEALSENAYGIYLVHYAFAIWLQYALLGVPLPAMAKGGLVFVGALSLAWLTTIALCRVPVGARLIRSRRALARAR
ncbi:MAG: acyltransferase, partial [Proteobacteria bacterium]